MCDRRGCENIMCDRYSHHYGYICNECFEELNNSGIDIETFMNTPKKYNPYRQKNTYEVLDKEFPIQFLKEDK